jgi:oligoribonuclease NrnB/cAMP/cGMP phosphodiesterase (DHH superfamily)
MNIVVVYHNRDQDGFCSGAIANIANSKDGNTVKMVGHDYGLPFDWSLIDGANEQFALIMTDVSLQPFEDMIRLNDEITSKGGKFIFIDHHISVINDYVAKKAQRPKGLQEEGKSACELSWAYFYPDLLMPEAVRLIGRYDVWDLKADEKIMPFHIGMQAQKGIDDWSSGSIDAFWKPLFDSTSYLSHDILKQGEVILEYANEENAKYVKHCSFETFLDGFCCIAVNKRLTSSRIFDTVYDPQKHDIMLTFGWTAAGFWEISLYSSRPEIDVSKIAKSHGGGGHRGAAGFQAKDGLPFMLKKRGAF